MNRCTPGRDEFEVSGIKVGQQPFVRRRPWNGASTGVGYAVGVVIIVKVVGQTVAVIVVIEVVG